MRYIIGYIQKPVPQSCESYNVYYIYKVRSISYSKKKGGVDYNIIQGNKTCINSDKRRNKRKFFFKATKEQYAQITKQKNEGYFYISKNSSAEKKKSHIKKSKRNIINILIKEVS